ncbi:nuclear transport factor 2 family protein [Saccharopolyspora shandongensis]|uniref:nuclear transport factor 2 family protein n=1 Tax=Saccharopolyspora shandongensis TaxID=418495 RepID=UPI0033E5E071
MWRSSTRRPIPTGSSAVSGTEPRPLADGTPRTQHVVSNIAIEVDEQAGAAVSRSYVTVLQALPDLPLQPIAAGRYHDRFECRDGRWRFAERRVRIRFVGDVSRHLR